MMDDLKTYLRTCAEHGGEIQAFILEHGREFRTSPDTFKGPRGPVHGCFRNAALGALAGDGTYVEGLTTVFGVPIEHAWLVDANGLVIDPTLEPRGREELGVYFGVPFKTEYLRKRLLKTGVYGLLGMHLDRDLLTRDPATFLHPLVPESGGGGC